MIYNKKNTPVYRMGSTCFGNCVGEMVAFPSQRDNQKFLWIDLLLMFQKHAGFGTKFLNFAQILSKEYGCEGKLRLSASSTVYDTKAPHVFYRKYGFGADDKKMLHKIDKAIKKNKTLSYTYTPELEMYYPDNETPKKTNLFQKILKKLGL